MKNNRLTRFFVENRSVLLLVLGWLIVVNVFAFLALNRFNLKPDNAYGWIPVERYTQGQEDGLVGLHSRWDSNWYLNIVKEGYQRNENDINSNVLFFPLYPFLIKVLSHIFGLSWILSGWFISSFFLFLSGIYLFRLVREFHKDADPIFAVFLMLVFPTAFFLNAVYTESLFMFLSLASFYYIRKGSFWAAGFFGILAALTRVTGVLLFIPLLLQLFLDSGFDKKNIKKAIPLLLIPIGTFLFFLFHWIRFGDFFLFLKVQSAWGRSFNLNIEHFIMSSGAAVANLSLDFFYLAFVGVCMIVLLKKKEWVYVAYMASTVLVAVSTGTLMSLGRYIMVLFPIFILGASIKSDMIRYFWIIISVMLMAFNVMAFVNWYWAG